MTARRQVRVAPSFFDRLDELLPEERTATGKPSATDFLLHEIPTVIDRLAEDYERHTMVLTAAPEFRVMIAAGILIPRFSIYTLQAADGAVEIVYLELSYE